MKAVYYISDNRAWGHVAAKVWDILGAEGCLAEDTGIDFAGRGVKRLCAGGHEYYFVPTDTALCLDYPRFLPYMNAHFADCDMSGMVTWHEGGACAGQRAHGALAGRRGLGRLRRRGSAVYAESAHGL